MSEARVAGAYWCFPSIASLKDTVRNMSTREGMRGTEDGGQRGGRDGTEGTEHLLVYGASGTERDVGFKHGLVYIFTRGPQQSPD